MPPEETIAANCKQAEAAPRQGESRTAAAGAFLLAAFLALGPLCLMPIDFWDGKIVDYALSEKRLPEIASWFFESRWVLQYYLYALVDFVSEASALGHLQVVHGVIAAAVAFLALENRYFAEQVLALPPQFARYAALGTLAFPIWHAFVSSILIIHIVCAWLLMLGFRLARRGGFRIAGMALCVLSLQLNSNFSLLMGLLAADCLSRKYLGGEIVNRIGYLAAGAALCLLFVVLKTFFPAYGLYAGYNALKTSGPLDGELYLRFAGFIGIAVPYAVLAAILAAIYCRKAFVRRSGEARQGAARVLAGRFRIPPPAAIAANPAWRLAVTGAIVALLFFTAAAPYIAVGKSSFLGDSSWNSRHAILLAIPLPLLLALSAYGFSLSAAKPARAANYAALAASLLFSLSLLYSGYQKKADFAAFEAALAAALEPLPPPPGTVHVSLSRQSPMAIGFYEANQMFYRTFGKAVWLVAIDTERLSGKFDNTGLLKYFSAEYAAYREGAQGSVAKAERCATTPA